MWIEIPTKDIGSPVRRRSSPVQRNKYQDYLVASKNKIQHTQVFPRFQRQQAPAETVSFQRNQYSGAQHHV